MEGLFVDGVDRICAAKQAWIGERADF